MGSSLPALSKSNQIWLFIDLSSSRISIRDPWSMIANLFQKRSRCSIFLGLEKTWCLFKSSSTNRQFFENFSLSLSLDLCTAANSSVGQVINGDSKFENRLKGATCCTRLIQFHQNFFGSLPIWFLPPDPRSTWLHTGKEFDRLPLESLALLAARGTFVVSVHRFFVLRTEFFSGALSYLVGVPCARSPLEVCWICVFGLCL